MRIAIIGAGVSGIATAIILKKAGHAVTLFEKSSQIGGIWALAYPEVSLQNTLLQYHFSEFPWPKKPDFHPTASQIIDYWEAAIDHYQLEVKTGHSVESMEELPDGWNLKIQASEGEFSFRADFVISSIGQYSEGKNRPSFDHEDDFHGTILTERDVRDLAVFNEKKVTVVGFGKSALDMATLAAEQGAQVSHLFRTARWTVPLKLFGMHYTYPFFCRMGSIMVTSWVHSGKTERFLHQRMAFVVRGFWNMIGGLFALLIKARGWFRSKASKERLRLIIPSHKLTFDLRSAVALQPPSYPRLVAEGHIQPMQSSIQSFTDKGLVLEDGRELEADIVVLSLGSKKPSFPFLPEQYRQLLEKEDDGLQLYRHILHPDVPHFAFAGYNHGFMHLPAVEVAAVWLSALLEGDLRLPSAEKMTATIEYLREWKREHIHFEPSRSCAINVRFQQYLDLMIRELGLSPYRKSNPLAEVFVRYHARDYGGLYQEYVQSREKRTLPLDSMEVMT